jgi:hypothetical protein
MIEVFKYVKDYRTILEKYWRLIPLAELVDTPLNSRNPDARQDYASPVFPNES